MGEIVLTRQQVDEYARTWTDALCEAAGENEEFRDRFWDMLMHSEGVYSEFVHYMLYRQFSCAYRIGQVSVVDIMIWQIDHFKAELDMGKYDMRENGDKMILMAFHTMLLMEQDPAPYLAAMASDTGTDYPGKI